MASAACGLGPRLGNRIKCLGGDVNQYLTWSCVTRVTGTLNWELWDQQRPLSRFFSGFILERGDKNMADRGNASAIIGSYTTELQLWLPPAQILTCSRTLGNVSVWLHVCLTSTFGPSCFPRFALFSLEDSLLGFQIELDFINFRVRVRKRRELG